MDAVDRWHDWLDGLRARLGSYREIARQMAVHENTLQNWNRDGLPSTGQEVRLSEISGEKLDSLRGLLDAARAASVVRSIQEERERLARRQLVPEVASAGRSFRGQEAVTTGRPSLVADPKGSRAGQRPRPITRKSVKLAEKRRGRRILSSWRLPWAA